MGLKIEIIFNLKTVNNVNVTLNLSDNSYKPLSKTNAILTYINVCSNYPESIVKQIPNAINIRINRLSPSKNIFNNHKEFYNGALCNSGSKNELKYLEADRNHINRGNNIGNNCHKNKGMYGTYYNINMDNKIRTSVYKNRHRNIIWFNPHFGEFPNINIGKYFLGLIRKRFRDDNRLRKIIPAMG